MVPRWSGASRSFGGPVTGSVERMLVNDDNLLRAGPATLPEELVDVLLLQPGVRLERIVSRGHVSAPGSWYDQKEAEWVVLLAGSARLRFEGESSDRELVAGDHLWIPARRRHRVEWTEPDRDTIWLAIFLTDPPSQPS